MIDVRLFRIPSFSAALAVNFLAIFMAVGYFLFVAQYLQLVVGLSPLAAGLWSVPSALGFIVGSNVAPRIVRRVRPAWIIGTGLAIAGSGLAILTRVGGADGLGVLVLASIVISLGFGPVLGLTTELIVGSAPAERAGAASGISETAVELGGALGISILGSIGVAIYRSEVARSIPASIPADAVAAARDTLGGATGVAATLPTGLAGTLLDVARSAFVHGMQVVAAISLVVAVAVAIVAVVALRDVRPDNGQEAADIEPRKQGERPGRPVGPCAFTPEA
jgi:DHA2 family multidrug resistance protein-like MFS transporter